MSNPLEVQIGIDVKSRDVVEITVAGPTLRASFLMPRHGLEGLAAALLQAKQQAEARQGEPRIFCAGCGGKHGEGPPNGCTCGGLVVPS